MTSRVIGDSGELIVFPSTTKTVLLVIGSLGFVAMGGFLVYLWAAGRQGPAAAIVGAADIAFFGACGIYGAFRLSVKRPLLVIDARGITDNGSALGVGFVEWDEIAEIGEYEFQGQTMLGIVPRDLDRVLSRLSRFKRSAIRANLRLGAAPINIPQVLLPVPVRDLVEEMVTRYDVSHGVDA